MPGGRKRLFAAHLTSKAANAGREVVFVNPAYTSRTCHACGQLVLHLPLSQRVFRCACVATLLSRTAMKTPRNFARQTLSKADWSGAQRHFSVTLHDKRRSWRVRSFWRLFDQLLTPHYRTLSHESHYVPRHWIPSKKRHAFMGGPPAPALSPPGAARRSSPCLRYELDTSRRRLGEAASGGTGA